LSSQNIYKEVLTILQKGQGIGIQTQGTGNTGTLKNGLTRSLVPLAGDSQEPHFTCDSEGFTMLEPVTPAERIIVLGGGHISLPLCDFAAKTGFTVTVIDDRPSFANPGRFPMAQEVICAPFIAAIRSLHLTPYDHVVILTRGHRHDGDCLRELSLQGPPAYLGMIGSRRRIKGLLEMLEEEGLDPDWLRRICTPVGLNIGAVTPAEIAVAILAEMITYKRIPGKTSHPVNHSDLEPEMIHYLAENQSPQAVVTILESKGSTPRAAGAKMSIDEAGQVTGTIGGGCSEGAVIQQALRMIGSGTYRTMNIDMTGEVAESEGMVCGGVMTVLIEDGTPEKE